MANTNINKPFASSGNVKKWTWSFWFKRSKLGTDQTISTTYLSSSYEDRFAFNGNDQIDWYSFQGGSYSNGGRLNTNRVFRDTNAWYHVVLRWDTGNSTANDRMKIWINGVEETSFANRTNPATNRESLFNYGDNSQQWIIGSTNDVHYYDGSISHMHFCDGQSYQASDFGSTDSTTGEWKINTSPSITMGTNGFTILKDGITITDQSSNSNDWSLRGGTLTKTEDCPSNVFATMNSLDKNTNVVLTNGNTTSYSSANNTWVAANKATLGIAKDKFYWEMKITGSGTANGLFFGVCADTVTLITSQGIQDNATEKAKGVLVFCDDGRYQLDTNSRVNMTSAPAFNDVLGCAVDRDNNTVKFYKNGSEVGSINISSSPLATCSHIMPFMINFYTNTKFNFNFGNGAFGTTQLTGTTYQATGLGIFKHQPPSGYTALCTKGLNL